MSDENKINIYIAGDSIAQSYEDDVFVGGWGQYLQYFFDENNIEVKNFAKGGRSSRSFINEGRLEAIRRTIKKGDYLFIQFCHNDDDTKKRDTLYNRLTPLGRPDETGRFPVVKGEPIPTDLLPAEYFQELIKNSRYVEKNAVETAYSTISKYGDYYYPYSENGVMGTYKWFLYQYIRVARAAKAIPVLVAPPPRAVFKKKSTYLKDGPGLHGGNNFAYVRAIRQLSKEQDVLIIDIFNEFKLLFENLGSEASHYLTSVKSGVLTGEWPKDYEEAHKNPAVVLEDTHFNKFGAYCIAARLVEDIMIYIKHDIKRNAVEGFDPLADYILEKPNISVEAPSVLYEYEDLFKKLFKFKVM